MTFPPPTPAYSPPPSAVPAGWYVDPTAPQLLRWWDGRSWSPYTATRYLPPPPADGHPTLPLNAALGALAVTVVSLVGSRFLLEALGHLRLPVALYVVLATALGYGPMVAYCIHVSRRWGTRSLPNDLGFRFRWADAGWGPLTWLSCMVAEFFVGLLVVVLRIPLTPNTEDLDHIDVARPVLVAFLISAVVAAPIVEELMFRGVVMRGLLSAMPPWVAIGGQGVLFGVAHFDPARGTGNIGLIMILSSVGIIFGGSAYLLRRLGTTMIAHAILNGVVMVMVLSRT